MCAACVPHCGPEVNYGPQTRADYCARCEHLARTRLADPAPGMSERIPVTVIADRSSVMPTSKSFFLQAQDVRQSGRSDSYKLLGPPKLVSLAFLLL